MNQMLNGFPSVVRALFLPIVLVVILVVGILLEKSLLRFPKPDATTYQAVFLSNGQAYFGKISAIMFDYIRLDDVHYLVANPQSNDTTEQERSKKSQLVKLGSEVHEPQGYMYIPKKQILFWEDMSPTSRIVEAMRAP